MEKVLRRVGGNSIIILFVVVVLISSVYMGACERKLANVSQNVTLSN